MGKTKVLILGASGMLGHMLLDLMSHRDNLCVMGTIRNCKTLSSGFIDKYNDRLYSGISSDNIDSINSIVQKFEPHAIINAIGIIKQIKLANDPIVSLSVNSLFPHILCKKFHNSCKVIQISTDCVFDGAKGNYTEDDNPNPIDLYGRTKLLGEVLNYKNCVTLRTSIIGHELKTSFGLLEWFRNQENKTIKGFSRAIYSGFTVNELEKIIAHHVLNSDLGGLYHVSSNPINKYDLLNIVKMIYGVNVDITEDNSFILDRSLNSDRFLIATGYKRRSWEDMIIDMNKYFVDRKMLY